MPGTVQVPSLEELDVQEVSEGPVSGPPGAAGAAAPIAALSRCR